MIDEPERYWDIALKETAHVIATSAACLRQTPSVLIICGLHNKMLAEYIMLEAQRVGARPHVWTFDEEFFLKRSETTEKLTTVFLDHARSLISKSHVIVWLSQFEDIERFPAGIRKNIYSFWDAVHEAVKLKPRLFVNLPSPKHVKAMRINYLEFLAAFINGVKVDYGKLRETGLRVASMLQGRKSIHVHHVNGTDLTFRIDGRPVNIEAGTLEDCYTSGQECGIDVPSGEIYVAPIETSAEGVLVLDEHREYGLKKLILRFRKGQIVDLKAESGSKAFKKLLEEAEGDKDKIGELGIGTNIGVRPVGWSIYDEKALGTAHIAIGNNIDMGGANKASIHMDFVLNKPTITADDEPVMKKGRLTE